MEIIEKRISVVYYVCSIIKKLLKPTLIHMSNRNLANLIDTINNNASKGFYQTLCFNITVLRFSIFLVKP